MATSTGGLSVTTARDTVTVPSPRSVPQSSSASVHSLPSRRLSLNVPSARPLPLPVPQRHGSLYSHGSGGARRQRASFGSASEAASPVSRRPLGSSLSLWASREEEKEASELNDVDWLDTRADQLGGEEARLIPGDMGMEEAVDILLNSGQACLLVDRGQGRHAFIDFADLNVFLLLVLRASSTVGGEVEELDRTGHIIRLLRAGRQVPVEVVSDISEKNPIHTVDPSAGVRHVLPLLASGIHRVLVQTNPPSILSASAVLEHLATSQSPPAYFHRTFLSPSLDLPLHPLVSLSGSSSVLDAMQVMSLNGISALGVLSGSSGSSIRHRRGGSASSGSSGSAGGPVHRSSGSFSVQRSPSQVFTSSPSMLPATSPGLELPSPFEGLTGPELVNVITAETCARLVVPSEGKQALGMGLEQATKTMQVIEHAGQARGEERVPVHTITAHSSLLHASHLILATSSSRVFLRTPYGLSPPLSPTPSLSTSQTSPPPSPSVSSLSLSMSDLNLAAGRTHRPGLPPPPATQLSPHYVVSITDILASLARAYQHELPRSALSIIDASAPPDRLSGNWSLDPETMTRRRRESMTAAAGQTLGLESWKWAVDKSDTVAKPL